MATRKYSAVYKSTKKRYSDMVRDTPYPGVQCTLCGFPIRRVEDASVDHILPVAKGGEDDEANFQIAHLQCNVRKGNGKEIRKHRCLQFD